MKNLFLALVLTSALSACKSAPPAETKPAPIAPTTVEAAVGNPVRNTENVKRDRYRHPVETLNFFGVKPDMTVVEVIPGKGWYTEILAPLLNSHGQYVGAVSLPPDMKEDPAAAWITAHSDIAGNAKTVSFAPPAEMVPAGTADMVLTFRNVHNWMGAGKAQEAFRTFYKALKPGGILGVTEHRANKNAKFDPKAKSGYVREADVIKFAKKAGFKLDQRSEINANPQDTKDYPQGVWTLPPTLKLKDQDREKYLAIGESDRMTLRFVKPAKK